MPKPTRPPITPDAERDYLLGTHDQEVERLGLQHRVWRPTVLECWRQAGISAGSRVLDVGAGPGYAALDLAEIVGPTGEVVAVERSARFVQAAETVTRARGIKNVRFYELDLMNDPLPGKDFDAAWCRWVAAFVLSPETLISKLAAAIRPNGVAIYHEYADYVTWRMIPESLALEDFVRRVIEKWRAAGGEPDLARSLPALLSTAGFRIRSAVPRIFCARPGDPMWQWTTAFVESSLKPSSMLGEVDENLAETLRRDLKRAESDPNTFMITPLVLEIIAERLAP